MAAASNGLRAASLPQLEAAWREAKAAEGGSADAGGRGDVRAVSGQLLRLVLSAGDGRRVGARSVILAAGGRASLRHLFHHTAAHVERK